MKWVSRINLLTMSVALAMAARPVAANPIVQSSAPDASANPQGLMWAWEGGCTVRPFLAIVTNPASASLDPSELQHQLARLNALNAMSLAGQGSLGELSISQLDMASTIALAVADQITTDDAMLVQAETAQDLLAALIGLPMLGIDGLASVDVLAAGGDVDAALAALLDGVTNLTFDQILSDAADAANGDGVNFASSSGSGAWYGGHLYDGSTGASSGGSVISAANQLSNSSTGTSGFGSGSAGGSAVSHASVAAPADPAAAAAAVPLPAGGWAGLLTLALLAVVSKRRTRVLAD